METLPPGTARGQEAILLAHMIGNGLNVALEQVVCGERLDSIGSGREHCFAAVAYSCNPSTFGGQGQRVI